MAKAEVNIKKLNHDYTMKVKVNVTNEFKIRLFLATALIKAAARLLGCNIEIENGEAH